MYNISLHHKVQSKPHIISRKEKNCYLLVNRENGIVLVLNDLGMEIWNCLSDKVTIEDVVKKFAEKYNAELEVVSEEILNFIKKLLENGFLNCYSQ